ncbi:MAG: hypothetical protein AAF581_16635 [Planctomycetota bacterium]
MTKQRRLSGIQQCWRMAAIIVACTICSSALAQKETRRDLISLKSVQATKKDGKWVIAVRGAGKKLPKGTKVNFHLTWRGQDVAVFKESVSGDFNLNLSPKKVPITQDEFFIKTIILLEDQTTKVKKRIKGDTDTFAPAAAPWTSHFFDHGVRLATSEEIAAELQEIKKYFKERYTELAKMDQKVKTNVEAAEAATDFDKGGAFDTKKWRKWFDTDVVGRIKEIQEEINTAHTESRFLPYRRTLFLLTEVSAGVGRRSLSRQKKLYSSKSATLTDAEKAPEGLDTESVRRRRVSDRYLNELIKQINEELKPKKAPEDKSEEGSGS